MITIYKYCITHGQLFFVVERRRILRKEREKEEGIYVL
jgi:hypothetical protein